MELDWARSQPQEARGIELGRSIGREDVCRKNMVSLGNEASKRVSSLNMLQEAI
jgi:hypothetical protein